MDTKNINLYTTRDLYLAATFVTLKFPLVDINFQFEGQLPNPVGYFSFEKTQNLLDAENRYWRSELALEPKAYVTNMKSLKSRISNSIKNPLTGSGHK